LGFPKVTHSHQIHGREVLVQEGIAAVESLSRLMLCPDADGHVTAIGGVLLGVTVADCVPVSLVDPVRRAVGLLHAGWRGVVAGILENGIRRLGREFGSRPEDLWLHLGPAICGDCYEVGGEVHSALGLPEPDGPRPVDLRACLHLRAVAIGVNEARVTESAWCTLCGESPFYSHRRGERGRQVAFLGIRPGEEGFRSRAGKS
jgi:YfiH family protein